MTGRKVLVGSAFVLLLLGLGAADAMMTGGRLQGQLGMEEQGQSVTVVKGVGVVKATGPDVLSVIAEQGLTAVESATEKSLLSQVTSAEEPVTTRVILQNGDRIGSLSWVDSYNVKTLFSALKQALIASFSPDVTGLRDEREERPGKAARSILTFLDPGIHPDRFLLVQSRERVYEAHMTAGKEEEMMSLLDALTLK